MTDEGLARQLETQGAIHDALFGKPVVAQAIAYAVDETNWQACPICDSSQIEGGNIEIEDKEAWQSVSCLKCGGSWIEVYEATLRHDIVQGETT